MKIENKNIFIDGKFIFGDLIFEEKIKEIIQKKGRGDGYIIPGLVEVHSHGRMGADFSDGGEDTLPILSRAYARCGVTSFLATSMSLPAAEISRAMKSFSAFHGEEGGAKCLGIHLEGPFLSEEKRGAHRKENLKLPSIELFQKWNMECGGKIKIVTLAPELEGAIPFIREVSKETKVSLGHTASVDFDLLMRAFEAGATRVTHLFNAMPPFLHRTPALVGASKRAGAFVELISDGIHVHTAAVELSFAAFGKKLCLISDSVRCSGLQEGEYTLGGEKVFLKSGAVRTEGGTLAGSCISLLEGLQKAVSFHVPLEEAVYAATRAPALSAGLDAGEIKLGASSDLVVLDENLSLREVYIDGKKVEDKSGRDRKRFA